MENERTYIAEEQGKVVAAHMMMPTRAWSELMNLEEESCLMLHEKSNGQYFAVMKDRESGIIKLYKIYRRNDGWLSEEVQGDE